MISDGGTIPRQRIPIMIRQIEPPEAQDIVPTVTSLENIECFASGLRERT